MFFSTSHFQTGPRTVLKCALLVLLVLTLTGAALAVSGFAPQIRLGYQTGDQWEPAIAADGHGHVYVLYPQYGAVPDCHDLYGPDASPCSSAMIMDCRGSHRAHCFPFPTGQFDPQIVVDPVDRQTVYASWMQNNKRDIIVARSLDFGRTWSFSWAERGQEDADKPVLTVRGTDVYVGFNHEEKFFVAASHDAGQTFAAVQVNPNAGPGSSLAGGATIDPAGNVYFGWTAYARHEMPTRPVSVFVSRSADGGRTWSTLLLDVSSAPPDCDAQSCETGYLGPQIALASDAAGALYALWNAGRGEWRTGAHLFFVFDHRRSELVGAVECVACRARRRAFFSGAGCGRGGRCARRVDGCESNRSGPPESSAVEYLLSQFHQRRRYLERRDASFPGRCAAMTTFCRTASVSLSEITSASRSTARALTHAVWGEGRNYKSPGSIWYAQGR